MPNYQAAYRRNDAGIVAVHQRPATVAAYDSCRSIPSGTIDAIVAHVLAGQPTRIVEAATGNGRFFVPLAKRAPRTTTVLGVDISEPMLAELREKVAGYTNVELYSADLRDDAFFSQYLPNIDTLFSFATLHIICEGWQRVLDNFMTSMTPGGKIILGEEINAVFHGSENMYDDDDYRLREAREHFTGKYDEADVEQVTAFFRRYHALRQQHGHPFGRVNSQIYHGDQSPAERYLRSKGLVQRTISSDELFWLKPHSFRDILYCMEEGTVSTFGTDLPDRILGPIRDDVAEFVHRHYDPERQLMIPAQIQLHVFEHHDR